MTIYHAFFAQSVECKYDGVGTRQPDCLFACLILEQNGHYILPPEEPLEIHFSKNELYIGLVQFVN
jgi:hypothetical protein